MPVLLSIFGVTIWRFLLDVYIVFIIAILVIKILITNRKMFSIALIFLVLVGLYYLVHSPYIQLPVSSNILKYLITYSPLIIIIIMSPDIRRSIDLIWKSDTKNETVIMGSEHTKVNIIEAVMELSLHRTGALITIEKHNTLDQYAEKAIMMNSEVSKELLVNIFTPLTPLHDGAVIIRGDKILCAGAYFVLTENQSYEKTMGSRHRAGLGISELTDSLTILVSEETGGISIAIEGILLKMNSREKLTEYLNMFMK